MTSATSKTVFMFKISLKNSKPEIWRRVLVPGDYTFKDLHDVIIKVMGWSDFHMHKFTMKHPVTDKEIEIGGVGDLGYGDYLWLPESTKVAHYFITPKQKALYEYDFGSPWYHIIHFEKTLPAVSGQKYPQCVGGKRATPPEEDPVSDSESEQDADYFDPDLISFDKCKQSEPETTHQAMEDDSPVQQRNSNLNDLVENTSQPLNIVPQVMAEEESDKITELIDDSKAFEQNLDIKSQPHKRRLIHLESQISRAQKVHCSQSNATTVSDATATEVTINGAVPKNQPSQSGVSIMSRLENDVEEDIEDAYGKYVASQMRLVADLEAREELRIEIQTAIKKYRFKKS